MPGISIISNFDIQQNVPIDSRMVVTSSNAKDTIQYKYEGLKVYQTDTKSFYTWTGVTWSIDRGGIYGGSGSLVEDTSVFFGTVSATASIDTNKLVFYSQTEQNKMVYVSHNFKRNYNFLPLNDYQQVEYRIQYGNVSNVGNQNGPYISLNATSPNDNGAIAFGVGENIAIESMRINSNGEVGLKTQEPKGDFQIGNTAANAVPLVFDRVPNSFNFGSNWYDSNSDQVFSTNKGSVKVSLKDDGSLMISNRDANTPINSFTTSLTLSSGMAALIMNTSPSTWAPVPADIKLETVPNYVNNYEHRFTKLQIDNWATASFIPISGSQGVIAITDAANSFDIDVRPNLGYYATNIQILRNGTLYDLPNGTTLNFRFKHTAAPSSTGKFYLKLPTDTTDTTTFFRSSYDDSVLYGNTYSFVIEHDPTISTNKWQGDVISFRRSGAEDLSPARWDVMNIERQKISNEFFSQLPVDLPQTMWDFSQLNTNLNIIQWAFSYKRTGKSYLCEFRIRFGCSASNVLRSGYILPNQTNPLYGKQPNLRAFTPGIGQVGAGLGSGPYLISIDITNSNLPLNGWGFEVRRLDLVGGPTGPANGYQEFPIAGATSGGQYWFGQFIINSNV